MRRAARNSRSSCSPNNWSGRVAPRTLRVWVEQQLGGIAAVTLLGGPRPVDAITVELIGPDLRQITVMYERRDLGQRCSRLTPLLVEYAELDAFGTFGEDGEVRAGTVE